MTDVAAARWHAALGNPDTRAVLCGILFSICEIEKPVYSKDDPPQDALALAFAAGRRSVGHDLRAAIEKVDPRGYVNLLADDINATELAKAGT